MSDLRRGTDTVKRPPVEQVVARLKFAAGMIRAGGNADGMADAILKDAENYERLEKLVSSLVNEVVRQSAVIDAYAEQALDDGHY